MSLKTYRQKRDFRISPEPSGTSRHRSKQLGVYVIQKHRATQLHYDFRLEFDGTLLSWAIPKGPSLDPSVKRLAMHVEDHPVDYATFEGVIPEGKYGGGTVMVWDQGTWQPEAENVTEALKKGDLKFTLKGEKLHGSWVLVRTRGYGHNTDRSWLLIKHRDRFASKEDITATQPRSAASNKLLADIARANGGDIEKAATGDPKPGGRNANKNAGPTLKILKRSRSEKKKANTSE
jgi:bifunctional non-homologous end joining protein LigD